MKCAKVLYDKDISDKIMEINTLKNENRQLKKTVGDTIPPHILLRDHKEWHSLVNNTLEYIHKNVCNIQLHNVVHIDETIHGLWKIEDKMRKFDLFENALIRLAGINSKQWVNKITQDIFSDLDLTINILKINERYTQQEINNFVYCFIYDKLCDRHSNSLLAKIPHYNCGKCGEIYNDPYDSEDGGETFEINEKCSNCYI